ncbi:MAG: hypothetical protein JO031_06095 [Ktedonobacteraceae bacterium]|nr:hypothetical protein [Ktedonobacteraceae bacterium]
MLQPDPTLTRLTKARKRSLATAMLTIALLAAMLLFSGKKLLQPAFPFIPAELWWFPALILLFFLAIQLSAAQEGFLRRVELRRQAAFRGDKRFLAPEQPEANTNSLPLPVTFRLRLNSFPLISALFVPILILFACWLLYRWLNHTPDTTTISFWLFPALSVVILLLMLITLYALFSTEFTQIIEVTDEGLRTRYKGHDSSIRWSDAQLFARYGVFGDARGRGTCTYELSDSQTVVKWTEYRRKNRMWHIKTDMSFEEYTRQMIALNEVVAGRTELELYDLR